MADLPITPVDPSSPVPLYFQVESDLRRLMQQGVLTPGASVPPELDLSDRYGVSRQTIRMALGRLVADELITRTAGRGTVVTPHANRTRFYLDRSFSQQMAELGRTPHSRVLSSETTTITADDPEPLQAYVGAPCFRLVRLRLGDDEPIGIQHTTILTEACPGIETRDFSEASLYDVLARDYRLLIREIRHRIRAVAASEEAAPLLRVTAAAPLLAVRTTALTGADAIIEDTHSLYRADRYEYSTRHVL